MNRTILVVEDDEKQIEVLRLYLEKDGYKVIEATDGIEALRVFREKKPDLILLDLMLPKMEGEKVCKRIRQDSEVPIIMLTAKTTQKDKIEGLDIGADDYVTKPFERGELLARIRANLRRENDNDKPQKVTYGDLTVDFEARKVTRGDEVLDLTGTEFDLLKTLVRNPEVVLSRLKLIHSVFGYGYEGLERTIDTHISNLREKLEEDAENPDYIKTVFGTGYRFDPKPDED
ncbi:MAG: response regulator [Candidatus Bipolaricaulia bacterium]